MELFKLKLNTDLHPDSTPPTYEPCEAEAVSRLGTLTALAILDKTLRKVALQVDFDPTTGRLNLTDADGGTFGHIEIESLKTK